MSSTEVSTVRVAAIVAAAFVATLALMIAAAYLWVWVYSLLIDPSGDQAYYEEYAQRASPVIAVVLAFPVFYAMGRVMRHLGRHAVSAAITVVVLNLILDAATVATMAADPVYQGTLSTASAALKLAGALIGAASAHRTRAV